MTTAGSGLTEGDLERAHPWIYWRRPVRISLMNAEGECWGCRFCIAMLGLRGEDVTEGIQDLDTFAAHMSQIHGRDADI